MEKKREEVEDKKGENARLLFTVVCGILIV